jgi:hypothetical protein
VPSRRALEAGAATAYLIGALAVTYGIWGRHDGVGYEPAWVSESILWTLLLVVHVGAGALIGRWWALALPVAWVVLSVPADGYDTPVSVGIAFNLPLTWLPALVLGLAVRKAVERRASPRARGALLALAGLAAALLVALGFALPNNPADRPPAPPGSADRAAGRITPSSLPA